MSNELEKARALIEQENKKRVEENEKRTTACWGEIEKVLEKHKCQLSGAPIYVEGPSGYVVRVNIWVSVRDD